MQARPVNAWAAVTIALVASILFVHPVNAAPSYSAAVTSVRSLVSGRVIFRVLSLGGRLLVFGWCL